MASKDQSSEPEGRGKPNFLEPKEIKRLIGILSSAGGLELELEDQGMRLRIRMPEPQGRTEFVQVPGPYPTFVGGAQGAPPLAEPEGTAEPALPPGAVALKSPMVGTFYRASSPDADPFVKVGDKVDADATVCILEAMKVMNEIKSESAAEILEILVENGEPVEFGQPLMLYKPL